MKTAVFLALCALSLNAVYAKKWALIVAGSNGWGNYRHQADVCHAYQVLHNHGIPDENIVVMMYDDIANNPANPYPGEIYNEPHGPDVYHDVPKDYTKETVTPENFLKIMQGEDMTGIGSGKTIASTKDDEVFVFFSDHGATGIVAFPREELHAKDLNAALLKMHARKSFKKLVFYLESCESGSMFRNQLPADIEVYAMTASDYDESSWGCYCSTDMNLPCLGDLFSVNWLQDSDKADLNKETLKEQHDTVKTKTDRSRVMTYGDLTIQKESVAMFQGNQISQNTSSTNFVDPMIIRDVVPSREVPLWTLHQELERAVTGEQRKQILKRLTWFHEKRAYADKVVSDIVTTVMPAGPARDAAFVTKPERLEKLTCHKIVTKTFSRQCFSFASNPYVMKHSSILANMCESGLQTEAIVEGIEKVCRSLTDKPSEIE